MAGKPQTLAAWSKLQAKREEVLEQIARGVSQRKLAQQFGISQRLVYEYLHRADIEPLFQQAMAARGDHLAEELRDIADEEPRIHPATGAIDAGAVAWQKLRLETRKWEAARLNPKQWGERTQVDTQVRVTHHIGSFLQGIKGHKVAEVTPIDGEVISSQVDATDD